MKPACSTAQPSAFRSARRWITRCAWRPRRDLSIYLLWHSRRPSARPPSSSTPTPIGCSTSPRASRACRAPSSFALNCVVASSSTRTTRSPAQPGRCAAVRRATRRRRSSSATIQEPSSAHLRHGCPSFVSRRTKSGPRRLPRSDRLGARPLRPRARACGARLLSRGRSAGHARVRERSRAPCVSLRSAHRCPAHPGHARRRALSPTLPRPCGRDDRCARGGARGRAPGHARRAPLLGRSAGQRPRVRPRGTPQGRRAEAPRTSQERDVNRRDGHDAGNEPAARRQEV